MKKNTKIWIIVAIVTVVVIGYIWNTYNYCAGIEVDNIAYQKSCMNDLSRAITLVTGANDILAKEDSMVRRQMEIAIARYTTAGQAMAWIQEQNLRVSPESYAKVQQVMETYYSSFYNGQTSLLDRDRAYKKKLSKVLRGFVAHQLGFPTEEYKNARIDDLVLEKGVRETYESKNREMPKVPLN